MSWLRELTLPAPCPPEMSPSSFGRKIFSWEEDSAFQETKNQIALRTTAWTHTLRLVCCCRGGGILGNCDQGHYTSSYRGVALLLSLAGSRNFWNSADGLYWLGPLGLSTLAPLFCLISAPLDSCSLVMGLTWCVRQHLPPFRLPPLCSLGCPHFTKGFPIDWDSIYIRGDLSAILLLVLGGNLVEYLHC